jgi:excisionase family DNA binding protein
MREINQPLAFTIDETAAKLRLGRDGIYKAIREGRLAAKKIGRRTLITADALDTFIENLPALHLPPAA